MAVKQERERGEGRRRGKDPTLVVTMPHLVDQFASELMNIAGSSLTVIIYRGDYSDSRHRGISPALTKSHAIFDIGKEDNAAVVIVTTLRVLNSRHGPAALRVQ